MWKNHLNFILKQLEEKRKIEEKKKKDDFEY